MSFCKEKQSRMTLNGSGKSLRLKMKKLFRYVGYASLFPLAILYWPIVVVFYLLFYHERGKNHEWDNIEVLGMTVFVVVIEVINVIVISSTLFGGIAK